MYAGSSERASTSYQRLVPHGFRAWIQNYTNQMTKTQGSHFGESNAVTCFLRICSFNPHCILECLRSVTIPFFLTEVKLREKKVRRNKLSSNGQSVLRRRQQASSGQEICPLITRNRNIRQVFVALKLSNIV